MQTKILFILLGVSLLFGCKKEGPGTSERVVNVGITTVNEALLPVKITHSGMLSAKQVRNCIFKLPGRIEKVYVKEGEEVKKGQVLVALSLSEYQLAYDNAVQIEYKAQQAYNDASNFFNKLGHAKGAGGVSLIDYEKARLDKDVKKADYEQAKINTELQKKQIDDCYLKADMDGVVLDIYPKQGELVDAGTLILNMRSNSPVAEISVSAEELEKISIGDSALVYIKQIPYKASVIRVSEMPNLETLTYSIQLGIENLNKQFYVGMPITTGIYTANAPGISIPVTAIGSDGEDYVFCVSNGRAIQKTVSIKNIHNQYVQVEGLLQGDSLIIKGMNNIQPGTKVAINQ